jgi:hypothetical protein
MGIPTNNLQNQQMAASTASSVGPVGPGMSLGQQHQLLQQVAAVNSTTTSLMVNSMGLPPHPTSNINANLTLSLNRNFLNQQAGLSAFNSIPNINPNSTAHLMSSLSAANAPNLGNYNYSNQMSNNSIMATNSLHHHNVSGYSTSAAAAATAAASFSQQQHQQLQQQQQAMAAASLKQNNMPNTSTITNSSTSTSSINTASAVNQSNIIPDSVTSAVEAASAAVAAQLNK